MAHEFQSARLEYRQIEKQDWTFFYRLYSNPIVMGFISEIEAESVIYEKFESRVSKWNNDSSEWLSIIILLKESHCPIGITGFKFDQTDGFAELGYMFSEDAWGNGFAKESLAAILDYSQNALDVSRFKATVTDGNIGSEKLLLKNGFTKEKNIKDAIFLKGKWHDDLIYKYVV